MYKSEPHNILFRPHLDLLSVRPFSDLQFRVVVDVVDVMGPIDVPLCQMLQVQ